MISFLLGLALAALLVWYFWPSPTPPLEPPRIHIDPWVNRHGYLLRAVR